MRGMNARQRPLEIIVQARINSYRKSSEIIMRSLLEVFAYDFHGVSPVPKNGEILPVDHETYSVKAIDFKDGERWKKYALSVKEDYRSLQTVIEAREMYCDFINTVDDQSEPEIVAMIDWRDCAEHSNIGLWLYYKPIIEKLLDRIGVLEAQIKLEAEKEKAELNVNNIKIFELSCTPRYTFWLH
jgi:hypothetical protein